MSVVLIRKGNWGFGPHRRPTAKYFKIGDIFSGTSLEEAQLVKAGWARPTDSKDIADITTKVTKERMFLALYLGAVLAPVSQSEKDIIHSACSPIDTGPGIGLYLSFSAPGLPPGGIRHFEIWEADEKGEPPYENYTQIQSINRVYGYKDENWPSVRNDTIPPSDKKKQDPDYYKDPNYYIHAGIYCAREGVIGAKRWIRVVPSISGSEGGALIVMAAYDVKDGPIPDERQWVYKNGEQLWVIDALPPIPVQQIVDDEASTEEVLDNIVASAESEDDAKQNISEYAKGRFNYNIDKRKSLKNIISDLLGIASDKIDKEK